MRLAGNRIPLERLSATSLSTYLVCPEQFRRKYLLNEEERFSGDRFIGSVTHRALQSLFAAEAAPDEAVDGAWKSVIEQEGEPEWFDTDATEAYRRAKQMIAVYWPVASQAHPVAVEERFEEKIGGVTVSGYIDVELADRIREVKTSARKETKPKSRHSFQGRLYSLVSGKPVEWHYVTRQAAPQVYTPADYPDLYVGFNPDATVAMIRQAVSRIADDFSRYGKDNHWPLDGIFGDWTCNYCSFRSRCPAWDGTSTVQTAAG